jgi:hypothetical protein
MFTDQGSWDTIDQLLFEDKWVLPRSPEALGISPVCHFKNLGWVFMKTGFSSPNDMAALFISQNFHWSTLDPYAQNSLRLYYKGDLLNGYASPIHIDGEGQRTLASFPLIRDGVDRYAVNSTYDVGPGITDIQIGNDVTTITADASHAYRRDKISSYIRYLAYIRPDRFVIMDRIYTLSTQSAKSWRIKPAKALQSIDAGTMVLRNGTGGALWLKRLLPESGTVSANSSQLYEFTAPANTHETIFVHVLQTADENLNQSASTITADDATVQQETNAVVVNLPDWQVRFPLDPIQKTLVRRNTGSSSGDGKRSDNVNPLDLQLYQNYPNPFNGTATISFDLQHQSLIRVLIYSSQGSLVRRLVDTENKAGFHTIVWDGKNDQGQRCASGIYICHIESDGKSQSNKMAYIR